jgi:hypothetical protein
VGGAFCLPLLATCYKYYVLFGAIVPEMTSVEKNHYHCCVACSGSRHPSFSECHKEKGLVIPRADGNAG